MVEKRCVKRDAKISNMFVSGLEDINLAEKSHSYPDKIVITNLFSRRLPTQLKGGYKK
jgi:hypothetical protein